MFLDVLRVLPSEEDSLTWFYKPHQQRSDEALAKWPTLSIYLEYMRNVTDLLNPKQLRTVVLSDTPCASENFFTSRSREGLRARWYEELCQLRGDAN